jgi:hypothetical protein
MSADSITKSIKRMQREAKQREAAKIYQFPFWPDPERGFPNEFIRSSLFAAIQAKGRTYLDNQEIACQEGYKIHFTGQRLDQTHFDVFEGVMHIARGVHEGNGIRFSAHHLLKLIGRDTGRSQHVWLYCTLQHLTATSVAIEKDGQRVFWGSLLPRGAADMKCGAYVVEISRDLVRLFERGFTQIDWKQRRQLRRKPLAQWLQLYYSSHAKPYPVSVKFLREKSGSSTASLRRFKQLLKAALNQIKAVNVIAEWRLEGDMVYVQRIPSPAQQRHLTRNEQPQR